MATNMGSSTFLIRDGKTLYFASARPGGYGKIDIYYSNRNEDGSWSKAENMGKPINSSESDQVSFIHTDSRTFILYLNHQITDGGQVILIFFTPAK